MNAWEMSTVAFFVGWVWYSIRAAWNGAEPSASWVDKLIRIKTRSWSWLDTLLVGGAAASLLMWFLTDTAGTF